MGNLKSTKTLNELLTYKKELNNLDFNNITFVLFPTSIYLPFFYNVNYKLGSQTISKYKNGSHTNEVLASQLKSLNVSYCLLNHAEENEKLNDIILKIKNAISSNITPVLCVGEKRKINVSDAQREVRFIINAIFSKLTISEIKKLIIAYEPLWAINQRKVDIDLTCQMINDIKKHLKDFHNVEIPILFGGGVNETNILKLTNLNIDGFLLGNVSQNPQKLSNILSKISKIDKN